MNLKTKYLGFNEWQTLENQDFFNIAYCILQVFWTRGSESRKKQHKGFGPEGIQTRRLSTFELASSQPISILDIPLLLMFTIS